MDGIMGGEEEKIMNAVNETTTSRKWTVAELRKLPVDERNTILAEQAALLEEEYRTNRDLTDFEAFGPRDLYGDSANTETR